ncbi:MAG: hypothetical protein M0D55_13635 [Elusimicrobiota bacterium]|nr:MAG: hypothetical protein M0D55_13635 [Elusimicrobiota bacterium]
MFSLMSLTTIFLTSKPSSWIAASSRSCVSGRGRTMPEKRIAIAWPSVMPIQMGSRRLPDSSSRKMMHSLTVVASE